jgi:lysozyme family protein
MSDLVERLIDPLIGREGGYANHPNDRGGETMCGITAAVARGYGYQGAMAAMPRAEAVRIYGERYWRAPGFDLVAFCSPAVAEELFDTGVNMGPATAIGFLQEALNGFNREGADYPDLRVDAEIGPATLSALRAFLKRRGAEGEGVLLKALNCLQGARYFAIAGARPGQEDFLYGWIRTRVGALAA